MDAESLIDDLGTGCASVESVRQLRSGQVTKRLLMLKMLMEKAGDRFPDHIKHSAFLPAYEALTRTQADNPRAVGQLLGYPGTGAWLSHCLRRLARPTQTAETPLWADLGYLGWLAAGARSAVAADGAADESIPVVIRDGEVMLPGTGLARVSPGAESGMGTFRPVSRTRFEISFRQSRVRGTLDESGAQRGWCPLPRITFPWGDPFSIRVDESDPFLNMHRRRARSGTGLCEFTKPAAWQSLFDCVTELLTVVCPGRAAPIAHWLTVVHPPGPGAPGQATSSTSPASYGCVEMSAPRDAMELALTLVHEFQHATLGALLDYASLTVPAGGRQFYAPWVGEMRAAELLLQGAYAHLAVADFWRGYRNFPDAGKRQGFAEAECARVRAQVGRAIDQLRGSGALTSAGERFAERMRVACDGLDGTPGRPLPGV